MPTCTNMCHSVPTWANIAVCQLCRERQPFWNSHDGLNLTCLDQCNGVGSHGTSSSQGRRKRIVIQQSDFDPTSLFSPKVTVAGLPRKSFPTEACLCGHQCFAVVAQATAKIRPRAAQERIS